MSEVIEDVHRGRVADQSRNRLICSTRLLISVLVMMGIFCQYAAKLDLSVNILCMVNSTNETSSNLQWNSQHKHNLLAAFFYGYLMSEIPGGLLAQRLGSKITMAVGVGLNMLCAWHYGIAAEASYSFMFFLRVLVGIGSGVILPAASNIWTTWAPKSERSFLISLATSGAHIAPIVILPLSGYLCENGFTHVKWKSIFYVVAIIETVWLVLWVLLFSDSPKDSRLIRDKELTYIQNNIETRESVSHDMNAPWKSILTSKATLALFACHTFANWGFYTLLVEVPSFLMQVFNKNIKNSGLYSSIPYVVIWFTSTSSSFMADFLLRRGLLNSRTAIRKAAVFVGTVLPALFLIGLGFTKTFDEAIICLAFGQGLFGIAWGAGHMCNANDIAPVHAGVVFGISNTLATIPGIITPYVTSVLTIDDPGSVANKTGWQIVFGISAGFMILAGLVFVFFGSAKPQQWDSDFQVEQHRGSYVSMQ